MPNFFDFLAAPNIGEQEEEPPKLTIGGKTKIKQPKDLLAPIEPSPKAPPPIQEPDVLDPDKLQSMIYGLIQERNDPSLDPLKKEGISLVISHLLQKRGGVQAEETKKNFVGPPVPPPEESLRPISPRNIPEGPGRLGPEETASERYRRYSNQISDLQLRATRTRNAAIERLRQIEFNVGAEFGEDYAGEARRDIDTIMSQKDVSPAVLEDETAALIRKWSKRNPSIEQKFGDLPFEFATAGDLDLQAKKLDEELSKYGPMPGATELKKAQIDKAKKEIADLESELAKEQTGVLRKQEIRTKLSELKPALDQLLSPTGAPVISPKPPPVLAPAPQTPPGVDLTPPVSTAPPTAAEAISGMNMPSPAVPGKTAGAVEAPALSNDNLMAIFRGAGYKEDDIIKAVSDFFKRSKGMGLNIDPSQEVDPVSGIQTALKYFFPEAIDAFASFAREVNNANRPQEAGGTGTTGAQGQTADPLMVEYKQLRAQLNDTQALRTWPSIIAFILLSMIIGPKMAFLFFTKADARQKLKDQINDVVYKMKRRDAKEEETKKAVDEARKLGATALLKEQSRSTARQDLFARQLLLLRERGEQELKKAHAVAMLRKAGKDEMLDKLEAEYKRALGQAAGWAKGYNTKKSDEWMAASEEIIRKIAMRGLQLENEKKANVELK